MLAREHLAFAQVPGGALLELVRHGTDFIVTVDRSELMSTRMRYSEEQLAELTLARLKAEAPRVLIGGYGLGFTLRAALALANEHAQIVVAEIVPEILEWAKGPMAALTGTAFEDPRTKIVIGDVVAAIDDAMDGTTPRYDAILLDVDNGPDGVVRTGNGRLYSRTGLARARDALNPGGVLAVWSAGGDPAFTKRLEDARFEIEELSVRARPNNKGPRHTIWFARRSGEAPASRVD